MDFLSTSVWIWEFLVLGLLPLFSGILAVIYITAISKALNITAGKAVRRWMSQLTRRRA